MGSRGRGASRPPSASCRVPGSAPRARGSSSVLLLRLAVRIGPDADVVRLEAQAHAALELERLDVGAWQLQATGAVEDRELLGDDLVIAVVRYRRATQGLRRRAPVTDGHRELD